ncbi:hypothetical protein [Thiocapsa sp.]|uniref:hypothetical protein n=1 Tax=Thiocapsa sp. TaxID=2024551 RepID=UPI0025E151EF|nr:hypothetical protein [Thiocapsa sp.]
MTTVTIEVAGIESTKRRTKAAFHGEPQGCFITFPSHEDRWATLKANRWGILKVMTGANAGSFVSAACATDDFAANLMRCCFRTQMRNSDAFSNHLHFHLIFSKLKATATTDHSTVTDFARLRG